MDVAPQALVTFGKSAILDARKQETLLTMAPKSIVQQTYPISAGV